ncbi:TPA: hypothetical protein ACH3X3_007620 [Trebouxia sp. C0006]
MERHLTIEKLRAPVPRLFEAVLHQTQMVLQKFAEGKVVHHRLEYEGATRLMDTVADHIDSVWVGRFTMRRFELSPLCPDQAQHPRWEGSRRGHWHHRKDLDAMHRSAGSEY